MIIIFHAITCSDFCYIYYYFKVADVDEEDVDEEESAEEELEDDTDEFDTASPEVGSVDEEVDKTSILWF